MDEAIIKIDQLSHRYSIQWAVKDISFEIPQRGIYGLLGSNGAGKSTLMNIICGVLKQTQGTVLVKGIDTREDAIAAKRHIGFLPQTPPLYKDLTVEEYLTYAADLHLMDEKDIPGALDEVLELCKIAHFRKRLLKNLSGGYQQRVGIAQAIIHKPDIVILDEPTNGLDPNQIIEIRRLIKDIAEERTVILSTHILREVQAVCDHILMIERGKLVFVGTVDEFDNYIVPNSLMLVFKNPPSVEALRALPGVTGVEPLGEGRFRARYTDAQEATEEIVEQSSRNRWKLMEIAQEKSSLDAIFAELSQKARV